MPKYYCDYCDKYLTHDSASVRKAHAGGRQHNQLIREHYQRVADRLAARAARKKPKSQRAEVRPGMPMPFLPKDYPEQPLPGMPLAVPYGVPPRPGFPPQTIVPQGTLPIVAPGVAPPLPPVDLASAPLNGAIVTPFGTLLPPAALAGRFDATAPPQLPPQTQSHTHTAQPMHAPMHRGRAHFEDRGDRGDRGHYGGGGGGYRR